MVATRRVKTKTSPYCFKKQFLLWQCMARLFVIRAQVYQSLDSARSRYHEYMSEENGAQTLLIDADDTLWENNIYFERAIARFISFLNHREYSPEMVRLVLNDMERDCIVKHGYGLHSFAHSLVETFEKLSVDPITPELHERIHSFAHQIADHPIEILPGVPETLDYLAERHHLILMTKGVSAEQSAKVERSGLKKYFSAVEIVAEKDESTFRSAIAKYALRADTTWMVGNSPKSDINPALAAGLHAVFIPHDNTWILEHEEVAPVPASQRLLVVDRFADLTRHF
jgi:putative hydrolase of the HAD superfamily